MPLQIGTRDVSPSPFPLSLAAERSTPRWLVSRW